MKIQALLRYVVMDLTNSRGRYEIWVGILTIAFAAGSLALLFALSSGTEQMVDASFKKARPIMGVLVVTPRANKKLNLTGNALTEKQMQFLTQLTQQEPNLEAISWIVEKRGNQNFAEGFWVWNADGSKKVDASFNAVNYDDPMLKPEFGLSYQAGKPFSLDDKSIWQFGVIINARFLTDENQDDINGISTGLGYHESDIKAFENGEKDLYIILQQANNIGPNSVNIQPAKIKIPVTGIVDIEDKLYPDLFLSYDVAKAYYNPIGKGWEPSYLLQFVDLNGKRLTSYQWQNLENGNIRLTDDKNDNLEMNGSEFVVLPNKSQSLPVQYAKALLWIRDYKNAQASADLIAKIRGDEIYNKQLRVKPPDITLTQALRRIHDIIDVFVKIVAIILIVLCASTIIFFGMGHVHRKKGDLGLLRACGMSAILAGQLFILQMMVLSVVAILLGFALSSIAAVYFEPIINDMINQHLITDSAEIKSQLDALRLQISLQDTLLTSMWVLLASLVGAIVPTTMAMRVDPMDQLRTQL
jgi:ABC-type antimicrobial peptide transport system permease subunit